MLFWITLFLADLWSLWKVNLNLFSNLVLSLAFSFILLILVYIQQKRADNYLNSLLILMLTAILGCGISYGSQTGLWQLNADLLNWLKLPIALWFGVLAIALARKIPQLVALTVPSETTTSEGQSQLLRNIYEDVQEAIFIVDVTSGGEFYYQGFNPAAKRLTGIEEVEQKSPAQIFAPETARKIEQHYRECLQTRTTIIYQECLPLQGKDTWWLTNLNPIQDETGKIYRLVGTSLNISDRKQAEIELDRERQFLQTLLDNLSDGIVACDRHGIITLFNRATREFHGLPQQAIPASQWAEHYDLYLPDGKTKMSPENIPLFRALSGESVRDIEMMIIPKQGSARIILANGDPIIDSQGEKIGAVVAMRDITERQQAEAELDRERVFIKTLLDNLSDGIVACDRHGTLALFNRASSEFFGVPLKAVPPEQWAEYYNLYDAEGKNRLKQEEVPLFRAFSGESFTDVELMTIPQQGTRTLVSNGSPIIDRNGVKLGAVVAIRDITKRKQAEREIIKLNSELEARVKRRTAQLEQLNTTLSVTASKLEQRNQELDRFAYVTSHDLKAPLRAIANLSQWIEEDLADRMDDETRYNMNLLRRRVHRLENLINALLAYSRVGRLKSNPEEVSVNKMLAEIIDSLEVPQNLQFEIQGQMPTFVTQVVPLQQVFNNLISNAIQHSDCLEGKITISVVEKANYYEFAVADNGKGIDPKYHDQIFTIFQTLESRDVKESTGIGLAIVKKAVEDRRGQIRVESQLNAGATFYFTWSKSDAQTD